MCIESKGRSVASREQRNGRYWHLADIENLPANVRFLRLGESHLRFRAVLINHHE